jgi:hypothetical protein
MVRVRQRALAGPKANAEPEAGLPPGPHPPQSDAIARSIGSSAADAWLYQEAGQAVDTVLSGGEALSAGL